MAGSRAETRTGGRPASTGVIPGDYALSVGRPAQPAPEGWRWTELSDVARLETGHTPSRKHPEYWGGDVPWVGIKDATENHGRVLTDTLQHTNELGIANSSARVLPANTVCLSRTASVGYVIVMGRPMATSQDFVNWVCSEAIDHRFLKYVLLAERSAFLRFASGTTHQTIYFPEVKAFHVCLPPPDEQRAIAHILGTLDDKIELNRRMSETLEAMARALFKSWFVDFDPVRTKAEGRDPGLPQPLADLFPARLVDSELGEIPEGWEVGTVSDFAHVSSGKRPEVRFPEPSDEAAVPLWGGNGPMAFVPEAIFDEPILLTGRVGTLGSVFRITTRCWPSDNTLVLRTKQQSAFEYLFLQLRQIDFDSLNRGSTQPLLTQTDLKAQPLLLPEPEVLARFTVFVGRLYKRIDESEGESHTLAALRDALLPKLISGELRVKDAETFIERVSP